MLPFNDNPDGLEEFLDQFERLAGDRQLPNDRWAINLSSVLSHKAREVYSLLPAEDQSNYDIIKEALFEKYHVTPDRYQKMFRAATRKSEETHKQFHFRVKRCFDKWVRLTHIDQTYGDLRELMIQEQIMNTYRPDLKIFLAERKMDSLADIADSADRFEAAHASSRHRGHRNNEEQSFQNFTGNGHNKTNPEVPNREVRREIKCFQCGKIGHRRSECPIKRENPVFGTKAGKCFKCGRAGHFSRECRVEQANTAIGPVAPPTDQISVNGQEVECLLDSGLTLSCMVRPELTQPEDYTGEVVEIRAFNGQISRAKMTRVRVESKYVNGKIEAAVVEGLPYPAMLGYSVMVLTSEGPAAREKDTEEEWTPPFHSVNQIGTREKDPEECATVTRAASKRRQEEPLRAPVLEAYGEPEEVRKLQEEDESLTRLRELASNEATQRKGKVRYFLQERLQATGLTARPTKCHIGFETLDYLGHQLSHGTIAVEEAKIKQLTEAERPQTKKGVRSFLGLAGYYRKFVPNFAQIAAPLTDLTRKGEPNVVRWSDKCEESFKQLKDALTSGAVLKLPDLEKELVLRTDASDVGLGAVILQDYKGVLHPVGYASRKLKTAETKYSVSEKECLAIVFGTQKFQRYLYGREFILETDHEPLAYLAQAKLASSRLMRWSLILQEYPMRIRYIKGSENVAADYMSRCYE